ncbi:hypothetical protein FACS1894124_3470 [Spirochaetia bacterium]|nr:hypothetical protein FACS1894124_3470 [Spirochaetia bacterium]
MRKTAGFVFLTWIVLTSCWQGTVVTGDWDRLSFDKAAFDRERAAWEALAITDYQFTQESFDESVGSGLVRFTVRENSEPVIEMLREWVRENVPEENWGFYYRGTTISAIYATIAKAYESAKDAVKTEECDVFFDITYNTQYHYPEHVAYLFSRPGGWIGGGGWSLKITDFTPLPSGE